MEINGLQILSQFITFGIILFMLSKFAYRPVLKILDERAKRIKEGLDAAEKSVTALAKIEETKQKEMIRAQKQAAQVLEEAQKKASDLSKQIISDARLEAQKAIQKEEAALVQRLETEEKRLKSQIAHLVAETTKAVLGTNLSQSQQREIITNQIKALKNVKVN